jgi:myo-inositol-1-phosphate synthase
MLQDNKKLGIWILGVLGNVSTCTIAGIEAIKSGVTTTRGILTEGATFKGLGLVDLRDITFGGYEIRKGDLASSLEEYYRINGLPQPEILQIVKTPLLKHSNWIKEGISLKKNSKLKKDQLSLREMIASIKEDLEDFRQKEALQDLIVFNLATAEAPPPDPKVLEDLERLEDALDANRSDLLQTNIIYAYAALDGGYPYINFTSSIGSSNPALDQLAIQKGVPHMGKDGKTGETLLKSALAPLFKLRDLELLSWEAHNILGNRDGLELTKDQNKILKLQDKEKILGKILEKDLHSHVRIDYVASLGDEKIAWDFVHFRGFLGVKMSLQFIWRGMDSILAAPLVIDLCRLAHFAKLHAEKGPMKHLASFFKNPYQVKEHDFYRQFDMLLSYVKKHTNT